jgi:ribose 5-phosphate isomerase B
MEIHFGSDHRGYELKRQLITYLTELGHSCIDHGSDGPASVDYPDYAQAAGQAVAKALAAGREACGVVICGSGVGIAIAADKVRGIRCVTAWCEHAAEYSRRHNHANMLAFGADLQTFTQARRCLDAYLAASPEGGRHSVRVAKINALDNAR